MGKREIKRLDHRYDRMMTYSKRRRGLLKKAYEIAVLCDVDAALIMYSPRDVLSHFSTAPSIEKVLQRFVQHLPNMPEDQRRKFRVSEETINRINFAADQEGPSVAEEEENNKEIINQYLNKLMLLQEQERMLNPGTVTMNSMPAFEERNRCLEIYLKKIIVREIQLKMMQQQQGDAESSYWVPPQGGQQLQQKGISAVGTGNSPSLSVQPLLDALPLSPHALLTADFKTAMPYGTSDFHQQVMKQQACGQTSDSMQVPVPLHLGDLKQEMPYGMGISGIEQTTISQPLHLGDLKQEMPYGMGVSGIEQTTISQPLHLGDLKQEMPYGMGVSGIEQTTISQPPLSLGNQSEDDALWAPYMNEELCPIGPTYNYNSDF